MTVGAAYAALVWRFCSLKGISAMSNDTREALAAELLDEPAAHMYQSDLERFKVRETFAQAFSIAVGSPDERSVPLYTADQVRAALSAALTEQPAAPQAEPVAHMYPSDLAEFKTRETHAEAFSVSVTNVDTLERTVPLYAAPAAPAQEPQQPYIPSGITLAVIGRRHFGNPIPRAWYAAAKELLDLLASHLPQHEAPSPAPAVQPTSEAVAELVEALRGLLSAAPEIELAGRHLAVDYARALVAKHGNSGVSHCSEHVSGGSNG